MKKLEITYSHTADDKVLLVRVNGYDKDEIASVFGDEVLRLYEAAPVRVSVKWSTLYLATKNGETRFHVRQAYSLTEFNGLLDSVRQATESLSIIRKQVADYKEIKVVF